MKTLSEMVREAGLPEAWISKNGVLSWAQLKRFSKLVRADEREACQKLAFEMGRPHPENPEYQCACVDISDAIIKRNKKQ